MKDIIETRDTYWEYAKEIKRNCPERFGKIDTRDLYAKLREINQGRDLHIGEEAILPDYAGCSICNEKTQE